MALAYSRPGEAVVEIRLLPQRPEYHLMNSCAVKRGPPGLMTRVVTTAGLRGGLGIVYIQLDLGYQI
jgi:hypothetical protein